MWYQPWFSVTQVRENEVTTVKHGHLTHTKIISASVSQAVTCHGDTNEDTK
jgi:hypothetical protein